MKRICIATFPLLFCFHFSFSQEADAEGSLVKWMTLEKAMEKEQTQPRPVIMDFYTDWCGWCKTMMKTTYANPDLAQYINNNFYPVKFNAETKDTITYLGQKYLPVAGVRATHTLANKLLQGQLTYPTTLFMNNFDKEKMEFGFSMLAQGYLESKKFEPMLIFTLENVFRNTSYDEFKEQFEKAFFDTLTDVRMKDVKWLKPYEAFNNKDSSNKKTLVMIHTDWCNACRVMYRTSFSDSATGKYLKEKFNLVDFDPESTDTITFKGKAYVNLRTSQMPFHQLAIALSKNSITLPTVIVVDEKMNIIDAILFYLNPKELMDVSSFYGDDVYKKKSWADYMAEKHKK